MTVERIYARQDGASTSQAQQALSPATTLVRT